MVKKTELSLDNDVNVIRDILFGDQVKTIQQQINQLEKALSDAQKENQELHQALDAEIKNRQAAEQTAVRDLKSAVSKIEDQIRKYNEQYNSALDAHGSDSKNSLKSLDQKISRTLNQMKKQTTEQFEKHEALHEDLVRMLALALLKYQDNEDVAADAKK